MCLCYCKRANTSQNIIVENNESIHIGANSEKEEGGTGDRKWGKCDTWIIYEVSGRN